VRLGRVALAHSTPQPDELDGAIAERRSRFIFPEKRSREGARHDRGQKRTMRRSVGRGTASSRCSAPVRHFGFDPTQGFKTQRSAAIGAHRTGHSGDNTGSTKTERSRIDADAASGMGTACTRADERMAAAVGLAESDITRFEAVCDVPMAGLLTALPALCANGLLSGLGKHLRLPRGFYSALHILLILGFMALGRIRRPERLRHVPPGEFGKLIGLDRAPEVRTLRAKIATMARTGDPGGWMKELSKTWMESDPAEAGYLYVDGHVRVYHGDQANLSRRFVSRERQCLRGTTDYWVNDALGRPFFVVSKAVTEGLADCLLKEIVPDLLASVPQQPTQNELDQNSQLHRFVIVFDREGATHSLLSHRGTDVSQERQGLLAGKRILRTRGPGAGRRLHAHEAGHARNDRP
jgi:prepilin-type processing-associated H-X9-DG protein